MTEVVRDWPPNIREIRAVLPVTEKNIFAYGGVIYAPGRGEVTPELKAHEKVHFRQQGSDSAGWWKKFLEDPSFRLEMELEAHRAEWRAFVRRVKDRNMQARYLMVLSGRLAAPMYGGLISAAEAKREIVR